MKGEGGRVKADCIYTTAFVFSLVIFTWASIPLGMVPSAMLFFLALRTAMSYEALARERVGSTTIWHGFHVRVGFFYGLLKGLPSVGGGIAVADIADAADMADISDITDDSG